MFKLHIMQGCDESIEIDPSAWLLLWIAPVRMDDIKQYLVEHNLDKKFQVMSGFITVDVGDAEVDVQQPADHIETLLLRMVDEKVVFEYKLSNKADKLVEDLSQYIYGESDE